VITSPSGQSILKVEVETLLHVLGISDRRSTQISIRPVEQCFKIKISTPTTVEVLFKYYLEVCAPLLNLVQFAPNESARHFLNTLSSDKSTFSDYFSRTHLTLGRLLHLAIDYNPEVTWSGLPLSLVIESLPPMQRRYYSISSSSVISRRHPSISSLVSKTSLPNNPGSFIHGITSNYFRAMQTAQHTSLSHKVQLNDCPIYDIPATTNPTERSNSTPKFAVPKIQTPGKGNHTDNHGRFGYWHRAFPRLRRRVRPFREHGAACWRNAVVRQVPKAR